MYDPVQIAPTVGRKAEEMLSGVLEKRGGIRQRRFLMPDIPRTPE